MATSLVGKSSTDPSNRLHVLVVDDDRVNRTLAVALLQRGGYASTVANNGQEAVNLYGSQTFDLVLLDIQMPVMDGLEAARRIRQLEQATGKHIPIVALTASSDREDCLAAGMDEFIEKPLRAQSLLDTIKRFTTSRPSNAAGDGEATLRILLVEDSVIAAHLVGIFLDKGLRTPFDLKRVASLAEAAAQMDDGAWDLILLDLNLPDSDGIATFQRVHERAADVPIVILSGESDETLSVNAVHLGAQDYLVKGRFNEESLTRSVRFALERFRRRRAEQALFRSEQKLFVAQSVQQELFPKQTPPIDGVDISGRCEPAETVGGDYFDYIPMSDGCWGLVMGDVSGHGVASAFTMVAVRAVLRSLTATYSDVGYIVAQANDILDADLPADSFITLLMACLNPRSRSLTYVGAGHEGYLLDARGELRQVLEATAMPLKIEEHGEFPTAELQVAAGDILVLCTDGVTESRSPEGEYFGIRRLLDVVRQHRDMPARHIVEIIFHAVAEFARQEKRIDDVTVMIAKFD